MGIFNFLKKKPKNAKVMISMRAFENGVEVPIVPKNEEEEVKPVEYYQTIQRVIKPLEDNMVGIAVAVNEQKRVDDRIALLKALIQNFYDLKSTCISLGPDYEKYFSKSWEHCHNSRNPDFSYIDRYEETLASLQKDYDQISAQEALHEKEANNLQERVLSVIQDQKEILQTDIYKHFDPVVQKDIQEILYFLARDGIIRREKSGKTYKIYLS